MSHKKYRLPKKRKSVVPDPTPEEIIERCKEVQSRWDEETRLSRIVDKNLLPPSYEWTPPIIDTSDIVTEGVFEDAPNCPIDLYGDYEVDEDFEEFLEEILKEKK